MNEKLAPTLTARQREVIELLCERASIKEVARDLDISETRVNQYIRALKDKFDANSLGELVAAFKAQTPENASLSEPYMFSVWGKNELPLADSFDHLAGGANGSRLTFEDVATRLPGEWASLNIPDPERADRPAPKVLDGDRGSLYRVGYMLLVAFSTMLVVITGITMASALSGLFRT